MQHSREDLPKYRMQRAKEDLAAAKIILISEATGAGGLQSGVLRSGSSKGVFHRKAG